MITGEGRGVPLFTDETHAPRASTHNVPEMAPSMRGEHSEVSTREIPIPRSPSPSFGDSVRQEEFFNPEIPPTLQLSNDIATRRALPSLNHPPQSSESEGETLHPSCNAQGWAMCRGFSF